MKKMKVKKVWREWMIERMKRSRGKDEENVRKGWIKRIRGKEGWRKLEKRKYRKDEEKKIRGKEG